MPARMTKRAVESGEGPGPTRRGQGMGGIPGGGDAVAAPAPVAPAPPLAQPPPAPSGAAPVAPPMPEPGPAPPRPVPAPPATGPMIPPVHGTGTNPALAPGVTETPPTTFARPGTAAYAPFQGRAFGQNIRTGGLSAQDVLASISQGTGANVGAVGRAPMGPVSGSGTAGEALGGMGAGMDDELIQAALKAQGLA